jgi:hypothetical protein
MVTLVISGVQDHNDSSQLSRTEEKNDNSKMEVSSQMLSSASQTRQKVVKFSIPLPSINTRILLQVLSNRY